MKVACGGEVREAADESGAGVRGGSLRVKHDGEGGWARAGDSPDRRLPSVSECTCVQASRVSHPTFVGWSFSVSLCASVPLA
jgi:hypothetical protein